MKLGKHEFARLIAYLAPKCKFVLDQDDIDDIDNLIDVPVPTVEAPTYANGPAISQLMMLMQEGARKIEAIKMHRSITGYGLKESKDEVEKYWPVAKPIGAPADANLGDILRKATS